MVLVLDMVIMDLEEAIRYLVQLLQPVVAVVVQPILDPILKDQVVLVVDVVVANLVLLIQEILHQFHHHKVMLVAPEMVITTLAVVVEQVLLDQMVYLALEEVLVVQEFKLLSLDLLLLHLLELVH